MYTVLYMKYLALFLAFLQVILPGSVGVVYAQEEQGLFGFSIQSVDEEQNTPISFFPRRAVSQETVLRNGSLEDLQFYFGVRTYEDRSSSIIASTVCCEHVRDTLTPEDFAELLQNVTPDAREKLLPKDVTDEYVTALSRSEQNTFFSALENPVAREVLVALSHETLREVLLALPDGMQERVLRQLPQEKIDTFVEEENDSGSGGLLLVGLGAGAALYLLSTASAPLAQTATQAIQGVSGVKTVPFGGRSLSMVPCTCTPGFFLVAVGPPRPGLFMYGPGTLLFSWYNIAPPAWQLGKASVPLVCLVYTGGSCVPVGTGLYVIMAGTSLK